MKLPVRSCEVIRDSTSLRSNRSPAQASSRKSARWLDSRSRAEWKSSLTCCHLSGVIRNRQSDDCEEYGALRSYPVECVKLLDGSLAQHERRVVRSQTEPRTEFQ